MNRGSSLAGSRPALAATVAVGMLAMPALAADGPKVSFDRDIRPILDPEALAQCRADRSVERPRPGAVADEAGARARERRQPICSVCAGTDSNCAEQGGMKAAIIGGLHG